MQKAPKINKKKYKITKISFFCRKKNEWNKIYCRREIEIYNVFRRFFLSFSWSKRTNEKMLAQLNLAEFLNDQFTISTFCELEFAAGDFNRIALIKMWKWRPV